MVKLSPQVTPTLYRRSSSKEYGRITVEEYDDWSMDIDAAREYGRCNILAEDMIRVEGDVGDFYIGDGHAHVDQTMYDTQMLVMIRELLVSKLVELSDEGVIKIGEPTIKRKVTAVRGQ